MGADGDGVIAINPYKDGWGGCEFCGDSWGCPQASLCLRGNHKNFQLLGTLEKNWHMPESWIRTHKKRRILQTVSVY